MKKLSILLAAAMICTCASAQNNQYKLVWSEEFNYSGLPDKNIWSFDTKGNSYGWGNNEKQFYTSNDTANAKVENGVLKITALKKDTSDKHYTSARLISANKQVFQYGRLEIRAKLPAGKGTWPAIWMLGENKSGVKWPDRGEIDIMEHVGYQPDSIFGTIHSAAYNHVIGTQQGKGVFIKDPYTAFHVYAIDWTAEKMDFLMDGVVYYSFANEHKTVNEWPFSQPFFFILNLAIGGNWGGKYGIDDSIFPAVMEIDYVRVYQQQ
ncbi:MAG: glycoside hydrolase family 16 protein [Chitinophagaceae bacterium]|nr:glycoside hydrolase family 16 protein [Chitinophagaceae bacterium]